jgi:hypothetical protein
LLDALQIFSDVARLAVLLSLLLLSKHPDVGIRWVYV